MKFNQVTAFAALITAVIAIFIASKSGENTAANTPIFTKEKADEPEVEIADYMQFLQPFHEKMYWSIEAGNNELAKFYVHELGEKMLEVVKADVWNEGRNLSEDMKTFGLKPLENLKNALEKNEDVMTHFENLTQSCNTCHQTHKNKVVVIKKPEQNRFSNQNFSPSTSN